MRDRFYKQSGSYGAANWSDLADNLNACIRFEDPSSVTTTGAHAFCTVGAACSKISRSGKETMDGFGPLKLAHQVVWGKSKPIVATFTYPPIPLAQIRSMGKFVATLVILWFVLITASHFIAIWILNPSNLQRFVDRGIPVYGRVVSKDEENHRLVVYSYDVDGVQYTGSGHGGAGNPPFDQIVVGQEILVFYDREKREDSIMGYPQTDLQSTNQFVWAITITLPIFPVIAIGALLFGLHRHRLREKREIS